MTDTRTLGELERDCQEDVQSDGDYIEARPDAGVCLRCGEMAELTHDDWLEVSGVCNACITDLSGGAPCWYWPTMDERDDIAAARDVNYYDHAW